MKLKKNLRLPPPIGTVFGIPLSNGYFGHAVCVTGTEFRIYNIVTDGLTSDPSLFPSSKWMQYFYMEHDGICAKTVDEVFVALTAKEQERRFTWKRLPDWQVDRANESPPRPYLVTDRWETFDMDKHLFRVTEEEIKQYPGLEYKNFSPKDLVEYIEQHLPEMEVIHLREDQRLMVSEATAPVETFEPGCVYEIWLSDIEAMGVESVDDIEEELDDALEKHHAGEVIGTGGVDGQDQVNLAVQAAPGKDKQALTCIRRVLKALNADPETTDVWIQGDDSQKNLFLK